jgi:hypothetical protein
MAFQKSFPHRSDKSVYPNWKEIELSDEEEAEAEAEARRDTVAIMDECVEDAMGVVARHGLDDGATVRIAVALFEKRASHEVYYKEHVAKAKFDDRYS